MPNEMSPYILLGFFIAGLMYAFVPQKTFARHLAGTGWRSVIKSAAVGIPFAVMLLRCAASNHLHAPQWCVAGGIHLFFQ